MGVVHGGGWFIRSSHVALIYSPKPRIYFIHYAFVGAEKQSKKRAYYDSKLRASEGRITTQGNSHGNGDWATAPVSQPN